MDKKKNQRIIVVSIHPNYADAIFCGNKTVEFRRNGVPESLDAIVFYATAPVQSVLGYAEVLDCVTASPAQLWRLYGGNGGISRNEFEEYYKEYKLGKCYRLGRTYRFLEPQSLAYCTVLKSPPQSFAYLDEASWLSIVNIPVEEKSE